MATQTSILAWEIPWREKPGRAQSMGSQKSYMAEKQHRWARRNVCQAYYWTNYFIYFHCNLYDPTLPI